MMATFHRIKITDRDGSIIYDDLIYRLPLKEYAVQHKLYLRPKIYVIPKKDIDSKAAMIMGLQAARTCKAKCASAKWQWHALPDIYNPGNIIHKCRGVCYPLLL